MRKHETYDELTREPITQGKNKGGTLFKFYRAGKLEYTKVYTGRSNYGRVRRS